MSSTGSTPENSLRSCPYLFVLGCGVEPGSDCDGFALRFVNSSRQLDCTQSKFIYGTAELWDRDCRVSVGRFVRKWLRKQNLTFDDRRLLVRSYETESGQIAVAGYVPKARQTPVKASVSAEPDAATGATDSAAEIVFEQADPLLHSIPESTSGLPERVPR